VKQKLSDLSVSPVIHHCTPMWSALLNALSQYFGRLVNLESAANDYIIAAASLQYFKL